MNVVVEKPSENLKKAVKLSQILCSDFKLVRVDWMEYKNKIYFNDINHDIELGRKLNLKGK